MPIRGELSIAECQADSVSGGPLEQRPGCGIWHLALEPAVDVHLVRHVPAGKKRGERQLRIDHEIAILCLRPIEQVEHAAGDHLPAVGLLYRAHLGAADAQYASQKLLPMLSFYAAIRRSNRLTSRTIGQSMTR
jgi:hypothetical protein